MHATYGHAAMKLSGEKCMIGLRRLARLGTAGWPPVNLAIPVPGSRVIAMDMSSPMRQNRRDWTGTSAYAGPEKPSRLIEAIDNSLLHPTFCAAIDAQDFKEKVPQ